MRISRWEASISSCFEKNAVEAWFRATATELSICKKILPKLPILRKPAFGKKHFPDLVNKTFEFVCMKMTVYL